MERNFINVKNVEKPLVNPQLLLNTSEFILERNLINVKIVAKPLGTAFISLGISVHILERNPHNEISDGRSLF